jgi:hypothetical protein
MRARKVAPFDGQFVMEWGVRFTYTPRYASCFVSALRSLVAHECTAPRIRNSTSTRFRSRKAAPSECSRCVCIASACALLLIPSVS